MANLANTDILLNIIRSRRTVRKYKRKPISVDAVKKILEAGRWAPSAHNIQPWKFVVITKPGTIKKIHDIMNTKSKKLYAGFGIMMKETAKCLDICPLLIAVYSDGTVKKKLERLGEPYSAIGNLYELQSVSFAVYGMMLCAHSIGIGSACLGMSLFCEKEINALLDENGTLISLLSMGISEDAIVTKDRKPLSEIVKHV